MGLQCFGCLNGCSLLELEKLWWWRRLLRIMPSIQKQRLKVFTSVDMTGLSAFSAMNGLAFLAHNRPFRRYFNLGVALISLAQHQRWVTFKLFGSQLILLEPPSKICSQIDEVLRGLRYRLSTADFRTVHLLLGIDLILQVGLRTLAAVFMHAL